MKTKKHNYIHTSLPPPPIYPLIYLILLWSIWSAARYTFLFPLTRIVYYSEKKREINSYNSNCFEMI